ncbi:hypothetical protein [Reichenbachiella sp.]|uniref:hypothetical protein n=1 Tax=Reichenbachiella sp. TaxID=2184521 RepID=UPI003BB18A74
MPTTYLLLISFVVFLSACDEAKFQDLSDNGCTDPLAINYNINAVSDSADTCHYSSVIFYGLNTDSLQYPITLRFDQGLTNLMLDGPIAIVPQNCLDGINGTAILDLTGSETLSWVATTKASDETDSLIFSGNLTPSPIQACIQIHVAKQ